MRKTIMMLFIILVSGQFIQAQGASVHLHRRVADTDMEEVLKREVKYWSKFAQSEIDKGNMYFWGVFTRIGGTDLENEPNVLIVNGFTDIDNEINWGGIQEMFPDVKMEDIDTRELSTTTDVVILRDLNNHIQVPDATGEDFNFVRIKYHNVKDLRWHIDFEVNKVKPFFKADMDAHKSKRKGWGNAVILEPRSEKFPYRAYSYNLFSTLSDAVNPRHEEGTSWPDGFFDEYQKNVAGPDDSRLYRVIKVVSK
ncbi:hypothetical protein KFZ70_07110 [Tamlana fucoidanivorans]|uniref:Uncharacterized protein n=1 Tax=Allotamlana fucoidanivorans TaxID=2583814 RepID=A0A5C4SMB9_9FLAO|nr:hypothetical protein [Tamlana fucoidanivorans]TNJ45223.1 hypothetical protein FGF67_05805 [Tamlana fucoidanivorans]